MATSSFPLGPLGPRTSRAGAGGPKTAAGKARSAVNAVKHGLTSTNPVVLEFETLEAWEAYRNAFVSDLRPVGQVEEELALELALIQWRRRRVAAYEARAIDSRIQAVEPSLEYYVGHGASSEELEARAAAALNDALLPDTEAVQHLLRYEAHLDRKFNNTLRQLERLRKARRDLVQESYKTSSAPSVPPVPPIPSEPTPTFTHNPSPTENYKTNSPSVTVASTPKPALISTKHPQRGRNLVLPPSRPDRACTPRGKGEMWLRPDAFCAGRAGS